MSRRDDLSAALMKADAAGDTEAASIIAAALREEIARSGAPAKSAPAAPKPVLVGGRNPDDVTRDFWYATSVGAQDKAADYYHQLSQAGLAPRMDKVPDFVIEAGKKRAAETMPGYRQFIAAAADKFADIGEGGFQAMVESNPVYANNPAMREAAEQSKRDVTQRHQRNQALYDTGWGFTGRTVAVPAALTAAAVATRNPTVIEAALPTTARSGALQGAALSAIEPLEEGQGAHARAGNILRGAAIGGGIVGAPGAVAWGGRQVGRLSPQFTTGMQEAAAARALLSRAHDPAAARASLQNNPVIIPGTRPNTAEATEDIGLIGLNRTLANTPEYGNRLTLQQEANNAARVGYVRSAFGNRNAGSEEAQRLAVQGAQGPLITAAKQQTGVETMRVVNNIDRVAKSQRFINAPNPQQALATVRGMITTPVDDAARLSAARGIITATLAKASNRSAANHNALQEARRIIFGAQNRGETAADTMAEIRKLKVTGVRDTTIINDMFRALRTTERGKPDVASLYNTRKHITQVMMKRADPETLQALQGVVKNLDNEIAKVAPTYRPYLDDYAAGMRKADQMAIGEELLGLGPGVRAPGGIPKLSPDKFGNATEELDAVVRRASGFQRATAANTMTGAQRQAVETVRRDLDRTANSMSRGKAVGSNTVQNEIGGQSLQGAIGPVGAAMIEPASGVAMIVLNQMRKQYGEKTYAILQEAMLDPARAQQIISRLPTGQRAAAMQFLAKYGKLAVGQSAPLGVEYVNEKAR